MNFKCINNLISFLANHFNYDKTEISINPELCPPNMQGDITVNCYRFAKIFNTSPDKLAAIVKEYLLQHPDVESMECIKAFANITLKSDALFRDTLGNPQSEFLTTSLLPVEKCDKLLIEFSAPNTNKPQHLGHVRNNAMGMALCSILRRVGHQVAAVNLVNDRGIHICKSMMAYQRFGIDSSPDKNGKKGDHFVGDYYVQFEKELRYQINNLKNERKELNDVSDEEIFLQTEVGKATQKMLQLWEEGDLGTRSLWQKLNNWVLDGFQQTYRRMGVKFDHIYYESETYRIGRDRILRELNSPEKIFYKKDDGSTEIDLSDSNLGKKIVLRGDGTSVYVTQDIGTTILKYQDFQPDRMIWIVGDEQIYHFKVLFAILKKMGFAWADKLQHIPYGMVTLPTGKMKSREGKVVDADNLFDEMYRLAKSATLDRCDSKAPPDDLDDRARSISMGALKFMLLKVNPKTTISFDPSASIKFEGDTGPYIQYVYARIASILRKNDDKVQPELTDWSALGEPEERSLALHCSMYNSMVVKAAETFDTSVLANYLLMLTKEFNRFYKKHSVLTPSSCKLKTARIELCKRVQLIIKDGLQLLTIETLESM